MNKRNYVDFARIIRAQKHHIQNSFIPMENETLKSEESFLAGAEKQLSIIIDELVMIFKSDNPSFDVNKFLSACEIKEESK